MAEQLSYKEQQDNLRKQYSRTKDEAVYKKMAKLTLLIKLEEEKSKALSPEMVSDIQRLLDYHVQEYNKL